MFGLLKRKNSYEQLAQEIYALCVERVRNPVFYTEMGVPDSFDGRFDLLLLHVFAVIHRLNDEGKAGKDLGQALFDMTFFDMDQVLREMGIGDMGIPKHMRRMMKAFNGRMHAYESTLDDAQALHGALRRNVYGTLDECEDSKIELLARYLHGTLDALATLPAQEILAGRLNFTVPGLFVHSSAKE